MTKLCIVLLFGALIALACGQDDVQRFPPGPHGNSTSTPPPPTEPPHTTTPTPPTSVPTKPTTEKPTTPATTKPTQTPTKTPSTTTSSTTTVPPKPTSPPTTPKPTPTPEPPKPVEPSTGTWQVNYPDTNRTCLLLEFALQIEIPYNTTFNKTYTAPVDIPSNATASGVCGNDSQHIILEWNKIQNISDMIILNFTRNSTTKKYRLTDITVTVAPDAKNFPGINDNKTLVNLHHKYDEFKTSLSKSYKCAKKQALNLTDEETDTTRGTISVSHLQFEAFVNTTSKQFSSAEDCAPFDTPDVVPIAVGCALAALVIVVLIAYLIGRRRRQARGYLSM